MKHLTLVLIATLSAGMLSFADDGPRVRYLDPSGRMSLIVSQDIEVVLDDPIKASRDFEFDLTVTSAAGGAEVIATVDSLRASYMAHEMKKRLPTRHLIGNSFPLSIDGDGRKLVETDSTETPVIDLGPAVSEGYSIAEALADALPELPETAIAVGSTWTTERPVRSLEGWTWATGPLTSRHRVTAIDRRDGHTVVSVESEGTASLTPVVDDKPLTGDLKRTLTWTFDVTAGRLLSMSMTQESEGVSTVPQGEIRVRQLTTVELAPIS